MTLLGRLHPLRAAGVACALLILIAAAAAPTASAWNTGWHPGVVGRVYTETNGASNNAVLIFDRYADGSLVQTGEVPTGGTGGLTAEPGCPYPCPILDTQGELALTPDHGVLFAVNAGSNTITSFHATPWGLAPVSVISSHGTFPNSLTVHGDLLYALNTGSDSIAGFRFDRLGRLTWLGPSSDQTLIGGLPDAPRQIGFDNTGRVLVVTLLANAAGPPPTGGTADTIDTFAVGPNGIAGPAQTNDSSAPFPFAFAFDFRDQAIVAEVQDLTLAADGKAATFDLNGDSLSPIDTEPSNGRAPCWVVITPDSRFAYVVNTGGGAPTGATISEYRIGWSGQLTLLGTTPALPEFARTDEGLSSDGRYLYVLSPLEQPGSSAPGPDSHIDIYKVQDDGTLSYQGQSANVPLPSLSGIATY
jgi:6-phosphogluconolactonase